jgi:hexosaminidase
MIDTARHFLPLHIIYRVVDSLPFAKLNVLHWHNSDSESFPFQSKSAPRFWNGAYTPSERYTQSDIAAVVEYARDRGIRVMVEFDMPGHAQSWCKGYPEVCPSATCTTPLNPASNITFSLISSLLKNALGAKRLLLESPLGSFRTTFCTLAETKWILLAGLIPLRSLRG